MNRLNIAFPLVLMACLVTLALPTTAATISYRYDSLNRLVSVDYGNGMSIDYSYDAVGNITRTTRSVGGSDTILPEVTAFSLPTDSSTLAVDVTAFSASDNVGVTSYCIAAVDTSTGCSWSATAPVRYTFPQTSTHGNHTLYAFARDAAGNISLPRPTVVNLNLPQLSVTINSVNNGSGSVNSSPSGINCISGDSNNCSALFETGTDVTLIPLGSNSSFTGWGGACTNGSGDCLVTMNSSKSVTATFSLIPRAQVNGIPYNTLASAYAAVSNSGTLEAQALTFMENLMINRSVAFTLKGGYAADYQSRPGYATLDGVLTISSGTAAIDGLIIK